MSKQQSEQLQNKIQEIFNKHLAGEITLMDAEKQIDAIHMQSIGQYERMLGNENWTEKNKIYARNALRKVQLLDYERIKRGAV